MNPQKWTYRGYNPYLGMTKYTLIELSKLCRVFGKKWISEWKQKRLRAAILKTRPIAFDRTATTEICCLTSKRDFCWLILGLKSFFRFGGISTRLLIIDDGSLTQREYYWLSFHLKDCRIITSERLETEAKRRFGDKHVLVSWLHIYSVRKKVGPLLFAEAETLLFMDSDVLFYKKPKELYSFIKEPQGVIYSPDNLDSYILSQVEAKYWFGKKMRSRLNSGIVGLPRTMMSEKLLSRLVSLFVTEMSVERPWQIQAYFALLFAELHESLISVLPETYKVGLFEVDDETVCGHYTQIARHRYWNEAFKILHQLP